MVDTYKRRWELDYPPGKHANFFFFLKHTSLHTGIKSQWFLIKNPAKIPQVVLMKTNDGWKVFYREQSEWTYSEFRINNNSEV